MLKGKKILIGITGSIAAYKIPLLLRLLVKQQAEVQVVMTPSAFDFVTALTLSTLSKRPVLAKAFDPETGQWESHVELGLWADLMLIAPASANTLAKMTLGIADNYLLTVYLSARCPVFFAPAMDLDMYKHPTTQQNVKSLVQRGHQLIAPASGELASGLCGEGRMEEPEQIFERIKSHFAKEQRFKGQKVLISAGPTYEAIDPVRFIGNYSSGRMGVEIAKAFAAQGATVTLVLGPVSIALDLPSQIDLIPVTTAQEMFDGCMAFFAQADITIMSAAVADYRPEEVSETKIKKQSEELMLKLVKNKDILATMGSKKRDDQFLVGFALETDSEVENAKKKLHTKKLDMIVLNSLSDDGAGFGHQTNKVTFIDKSGQIDVFDMKSKTEVAQDLVEAVFAKIKN
ncbi:MAG: bifunctional phosphopantothenoylcysteine decarboxylase/phosphopantothenate--cysteine ligase CoaBC [Bacteroidales bacterium]|jgi:phosphopantothenoylcysteine decarboxylase/phosphopantothenate--cysteine ligase|nr:bifunctional phosphopantothenoylcysteine decarboxylase/phosphopantothenate--cysteine ligase CoaBC [Bacteroidales bacterium]